MNSLMIGPSPLPSRVDDLESTFRTRFSDLETQITELEAAAEEHAAEAKTVTLTADQKMEILEQIPPGPKGEDGKDGQALFKIFSLSLFCVCCLSISEFL